MADGPGLSNGDIVRVRELYRWMGALEERLSSQIGEVKTEVRDSLTRHEQRHRDGVGRMQFAFMAVIAAMGFLMSAVNALAGVFGG